MPIRSAARWATPVVLGISGISLLFSLGVTFGVFRVDVIEFFAQADQVNENSEKIKLLQARIDRNTELLVAAQQQMINHSKISAKRNEQIMKKLNEGGK